MAAWTSIPRALLALLATQNPLNPHVARSSNYFALRPRWPAQARRGRVIITVEKDRPGYVRGRTDEGRVGQLVLSATRRPLSMITLRGCAGERLATTFRSKSLGFRGSVHLSAFKWGEVARRTRRLVSGAVPSPPQQPSLDRQRPRRPACGRSRPATAAAVPSSTRRVGITCSGESVR